MLLHLNCSRCSLNNMLILLDMCFFINFSDNAIVYNELFQEIIKPMVGYL